MFFPLAYVQLQVLLAKRHESSDPGLQLLDTQANPLPFQALHPAVQSVSDHRARPQAQVPHQHGVLGEGLLHRDLPGQGTVKRTAHHTGGSGQWHPVVSREIKRFRRGQYHVSKLCSFSFFGPFFGGITDDIITRVISYTVCLGAADLV